MRWKNQQEIHCKINNSNKNESINYKFNLGIPQWPVQRWWQFAIMEVWQLPATEVFSMGKWNASVIQLANIVSIHIAWWCSPVILPTFNGFKIWLNENKWIFSKGTGSNIWNQKWCIQSWQHFSTNVAQKWIQFGTQLLFAVNFNIPI